MSSINFKLGKFNGANNFSLWQIKMRALLKQQGLWTPFMKKTKPEDEASISLEERAHSTIMLCLSDDIITEVYSENIAAGL